MNSLYETHADRKNVILHRKCVSFNHKSVIVNRKCVGFNRKFVIFEARFSCKII